MLSFSIVTFNIQFGQVWDNKNPDAAPVVLANTIAAMKRANADIFLLQEVEQAAGGARQVEPPPQYQALREAFPNYHSVFTYPPLDERELPFGFGLAIFSRFPLAKRATQVLPAPDITFEFAGKWQQPSPRILLEAQVQMHDRSIRLINTHLQAFFMLNQCSSDDFPQQRTAVVERMLAADLPTVCGGDFNIAPKEGTLAQFAAAGVKTSQNAVKTWKRMPFVTDHIFYSQGLRLIDCQVLPTPESDHEMVRSQFELQS